MKCVSIKLIEIQGTAYTMTLESDSANDWFRKRESSIPLRWGPSTPIKGSGNDVVIAKAQELRPQLIKMGLL